NLRGSFHLPQRSLQFLDQRGKSARRTGASQRSDQGTTRMFTSVPQIQVCSEQPRVLRSRDQILLQEFALTHSARREERLGRDESNLECLQVLVRQSGARKVPRVRLVLHHGWHRLAHQVPAGIVSTSSYQPGRNVTKPARDGQ